MGDLVDAIDAANSTGILEKWANDLEIR